jgi:glycosyltransferase involved in cell wall biosynthesis
VDDADCDGTPPLSGSQDHKIMNVGLVVPNDIDFGLDLANALYDLRLSVTLYFSQSRMALYLSNNEKIHSLSADRLEKLLFESELLPPNCRIRLFRYPRVRDPRSLAVIRQINLTMLQDGIDVAHLLMGPGDLWSAVLAHLVRRIPVVSTMIIPKPNIGEDLPAWVIMAINKLLAQGSELVIVNGASQVEYLRTTYRVPADRIAYVPLGPRTTAIKWARRRCNEETGTVLFFGRAHPHKGLEYLVKAQPLISDRIPHARILIVAHGNDLSRCRAMIGDSSKFEIHEGFLQSTDTIPFFERSSLVALPYLSASTSGILMTAYVFGKPVVASRVGCLPEYVEDGVTGFLVPPADVSELAQAIIRLLSDDVGRRRMGENARKWAMNEQMKVAARTVEVYERAIYFHESRRKRNKEYGRSD